MKNVFLALLFLFVTATCFGQIGVKVFHHRPLGDLGFLMKPTTSLELSLHQEFLGERIRIGLGLTYLSFKPRMTTIPAFIVQRYGLPGGQDKVIPGEKTYEQYTMFQLALGGNFLFIKRDKFNVFVGTDLLAGGVSVASRTYYPGVIDTNDDGGGGACVGYRLRLGAEYMATDRLGIFADAQYQHVLIGEALIKSTAHDFGLGVHFYFN